MKSADRQRLVQELSENIARHRQPLLTQMRRSPHLLLRRVIAARMAGLHSRLGWSRTTRARMFYGDRVSLPTPACWDLPVYGSYIDEAELRLIKFMLRYLPTGAQMVDVGANIGVMCQLAARVVGPNGRVFGFEPGQTALGYLRSNLADHPNVTVIEKAAMDKPGEITFYEGTGANMVSSSTLADHLDARNPDQRQQVTIEATTLDLFCKDTSAAPHLLKIDVEGAELSVLKGAEQMITQHHPWIVLEVSFDPEEFGALYAPSLDYLKQLGYRIYALHQDGSAAPLGNLDERRSYCSTARGYLHGLDNLAFIHPAGPPLQPCIAG